MVGSKSKPTVEQKGRASRGDTTDALKSEGKEGSPVRAADRWPQLGEVALPLNVVDDSTEMGEGRRG